MKQPVVNEQILGESVADHCHHEFTTLHVSATVAEALEQIRVNPPQGRIIYFYVIDDDGKLAGVIPTRRLLLSGANTPLMEVMIRNVIAIPASATVLDACEFFTFHRLLAFPIIDADRRMIGVIDVELYTSELAWGPEASETSRPNDAIFEVIGVHIQDLHKTDPVQAWKSRFPWLITNIAGGLLAAVLSGMYQDVLNWKNAVLALFIPVVLALSESVAIQSVSLAVGRLSGRRPTWKQLLRSGGLEGLTGVMLGFGAASLVALVAGLWLHDLSVVTVLLVGIGTGITASSVIGFAIPTLLHRFRLNPQVAAGPICLACADMITLIVYFNIALVFFE